MKSADVACDRVLGCADARDSISVLLASGCTRLDESSNENTERNCTDTTGTVLVPWAPPPRRASHEERDNEIIDTEDTIVIDGLLSTTAAHEVRRAGVLTCGSCHLERSARQHPHRG